MRFAWYALGVVHWLVCLAATLPGGVGQARAAEPSISAATAVVNITPPIGVLKGLADLHVLTSRDIEPPQADWLVVPYKRSSAVLRDGRAPQIVMTNGLISRSFRLLPNAATVGYDNLLSGSAVIRGVKPEAILELDGAKYDVGGLVGQVGYAYLQPEWVNTMQADSAAFQFAGFEIGRTRARFAWKRKPYSADLPWPPPGVSLTLHFRPPQGKLPGLSVSVCYEMYDGIPLLCNKKAWPWSSTRSIATWKRCWCCRCTIRA